jgi:hypothetical protein
MFSQAGNLFWSAGQEKPAAGIGLKTKRVSFENGWGIELGVGREANQPGGAVGREGGLQVAHLPGHVQTRAGTTREDNVSNPNVAAQISQSGHLPVLIGERKIGHLSIDWQGLSTWKGLCEESEPNSQKEKSAGQANSQPQQPSGPADSSLDVQG